MGHLEFGGGLAWLLGWHDYAWVAPVLAFLAVYLTSNAILTMGLSVMQLAGGGIWSATPMRWLVGKFAFLLLLAVAVWFVGGFLGRCAGIARHGFAEAPESAAAEEGRGKIKNATGKKARQKA